MMIWVALAVSAYSLYQLFSSEDGTELALSLVRVAMAIVLVTAVKTQSEWMISAAFLLNVLSVLAAMAILRKEVQLEDDERGAAEK